MTRPLVVLATFFLVTLGAAAGAEAAEWLAPVLAQAPSIVRGPGFYLNIYKLAPVLIIFLLWTWTTDWVEHDTKELNNVRFALWNSVVFFSGVLGLVLIFAIPIYPLSLVLLLLAYFVPILTYSYVRNQTVPDEQKVLTPYHLGEVVNSILLSLGIRPMFNKNVSMVDRAGPPITFVGKSAGMVKEDPNRVHQAEESRSFMAAKELVYDAVLRRATDIHLEPTTEQLSVRYRIDGILHAAEPFDRPTGDAVINVFKVLSAMDISEKRKPQDGSFGAKLQARDLDFRVATSGSKAGEKLVMRILDNSGSITKLEDLGMRPSSSNRCAGWSRSRMACSSAAGPRGQANPPPCTRRSGKSTATSATSSRSRTPSNTTSTTSPRWRSTPRRARPSPRRCGRSCGKTPT